MTKNADRCRSYVGTARGALEILSREGVTDLASLLQSLGQKYKVPLVSPNYDKATLDDVARSASKNLENLVSNVHLIRGLLSQDAAGMNWALANLTAFLATFALRHPIREEGRLQNAIASYLASDVSSAGWAGSALKRA